MPSTHKIPGPLVVAKMAVASLWTGSLAVVAVTSVSLGIWAGDHVMPKIWLQVVLKIFGIRVEANGLENFDSSEQYVFVSNHASVLDGMALVVTTRAMPRFVGKDSIREIPIIGLAWEKLGHILIDRKDPAQAYLKLAEAARNNKKGYSFYVAPEGTRFSEGGVGDFKRGAFVLAQDLGVPVVPLAISGASQLWPAGTWEINPGSLQINFGEPISVDDVDLAALQAKQWIEKTLNV